MDDLAYTEEEKSVLVNAVIKNKEKLENEFVRLRGDKEGLNFGEWKEFFIYIRACIKSDLSM
jgi:hypothetical protein